MNRATIKERIKDWPTTILGLALGAAQFFASYPGGTLKTKDWVVIASSVLIGAFSTGNAEK